MSQKRPVIFGEVLFDVFPGDEQVLGGAPFNVAWHLQGFGLSPLFVSAVGDDERGRDIRSLMTHWGMDTAGLQTDPDHPSGVVQVSFHNNQPSYEIVPDQAYDFIRADDITVGDAALLYHGSLALRQPVSRQSLAHLAGRLAAPVFIDINLRAPWWERDSLAAMMSRARWIKLNDDELLTLAEQLPLSGAALLEQAQSLRNRCDAESVIVTRGAEGAMLVDEDNQAQKTPPKVENLVDTVGAGDAFSSVCLLGLIQRWPHEQILTRALQFAARVCEMRGATTTQRALYQETMKGWSV